MPLRNRLRLRRNAPARSLTDRRTGLSRLIQILPMTLIVPIILFASVTAVATAFWTYDIHIEQAYGDIDEPDSASTMDSAN